MTNGRGLLSPDTVLAAAEDIASAVYTPAVLKSAAESVSSRYRRESGKPDFSIRSDAEAAAYLAARFPATFAAARAVMVRLPAAEKCKNMMDVGAGPGTAAFAAAGYAELSAILCLEPNNHLTEAGQAVADACGVAARWQDGRLADVDACDAHDLVAAAYVLNEISPQSRGAALKSLWAKTRHALVLMEPGTPEGYAIILQARDILTAAGGHIVAPCPQQGQCPLADTAGRWCHFSVRLQRTRLHKSLKGGQAAFEDEKYSYLIVTRTPPAELPALRLIGHPRAGKVISAETCKADGTATVVQAAKSNPLYAALRKAEWGDGITKDGHLLDDA